MTPKQQKIISTSLITLVVLGGLEILAVVVNLNQPQIFLEIAFAIYIYLVLKMAFLYDLHFKNPGAMSRAVKRHESIPHWLKRSLKILLSASWDRIHHMRSWSYFKHFQNYLLLPGVIFWSTVAMLYLNLGRTVLQQTFVLLSSIALVIVYWYLKEIFSRKKEILDHDIFAILSVIKLYAAFVTFSSTLGIIRFFGLSQNIFGLAIFALSSLLVYQALFQHGLVRLKNLLVGLFIALILMLVSFWVYSNWGLNYFTAGGFLMVVYNFCWSLFHHHLDKTFNLKSFFELLIISTLLAIMLFSVTNFQAKLF